jgi:two-component system, NarL family, nitrate/nitrite response regulator NarL
MASGGAVQRILVVDDHPLYREGMVSALRARLPGLEVLGAGSAEEGLTVLEGNPETDLVLIDLRLPGMDGFGALSAYATRFPTVSRVLISGEEGADIARRAFDAGASGFIPKSMAVDEVAAAIRQVLDGGVFVPAQGERQPKANGLTLRQLEALRLLGEGYTNKEIARALDITERTAKAHVAAIFETLGTDNRTQAVIAAQRLGYLPGRT